MATVVEQQPPIICRMNRLENVVRHLEEMSRGSSWESSSGSPSTCSDGRSSSTSLHDSFKHCRPLDDVVSETQHKGTLLYRLSHLEDRVLEVCLQMEKEMMEQRHNNNNNGGGGGGSLQEDHHQPSTPTKKLKQFVKSCVKSKSKSKTKSKS